MSERVLDLGQGLELWKVNVEELREQDTNARSMTPEAFQRLTATIERDSRLESLPLLALTDRGIEIISGHHRTRAARAGGVKDIFGIVDVTGLTADQIKAKQLAHNAIEGTDDPQLVAKIFESIGDVESKLEAFIDPKLIQQDLPNIKVEDIDLGMNYESVMVMFLPWEREYFEESAEVIEREVQGGEFKSVLIAERERWEEFSELARRITKEYDVRSMGTVLAKMAELAREQMGEGVPPDAEVVAIRDLFGSAYVPAEVGSVISDAIQRMMRAGDISERARWRALELFAADYLGTPEPA